MQVLIKTITIPPTMAGLIEAHDKKECAKRQGWRVIRQTSNAYVLKRVLREGLK